MLPVVNQTLYERLGGRPRIKMIVQDSFYALLSDDRVSHHFVGVDIERLTNVLISFFENMLGGPLDYSGESLRKAHSGLNITSEEYDIFLSYVRQILRKYTVSIPDIAKIESLLRSYKPHIINR
ncbi:group I truncated hemoglobin [Thermoflavimicrobium daqui]|uniref:Group 1 truncated hemoglobin n=1 Tax=Thermoflavimicrobium daqui TaxID=2137476 RepID=A0A364K610_9BACL|nr:group 1 truncated hemoglobin [Thermoflavimicrobium daqui]RAL25736.1 hypothetical protein DL897_06580 [Thermoflavimicrobium daqui]